MRDQGIIGGDRRVGWASLPSDAHPDRNEDTFFAIPERGFYGVFDGMGAHAGAGLAARIAADEVQDVLAPLAEGVDASVVADALRDALRSADAVVRAEGQLRGGARQQMGTTALVAVVRPAGDDLWSVMVGWAGDSRAVVVPARGPMQSLTLDDGVVRLRASTAAQARKVQSTLGRVTDPRTLTIRERDVFLERHVLLQAVGSALRHVHIADHTVPGGSGLVLLTDGVHDNLTDLEMLAAVRRGRDVRDAATRLVGTARGRSRDPEHVRAKPDDMTAIVIRL